MLDFEAATSVDEFGNLIAQQVEHALRQAIVARGQAFLALTGGKTPEVYLPFVFRSTLDWTHVVMTLADDRFVKPDHPDSNAGLIARLRRHTPAAAARWIPLVQEDEAVLTAAADASARLRHAGAWPLDCAVLGFGEDGHVASVFDPPLAVGGGDEDLCVAVLSPPAPHRHPRVSLSLKALACTRHTILAFTGGRKRDVYERAVQGAEGPLGWLLANSIGSTAVIQFDRL